MKIQYMSVTDFTVQEKESSKQLIEQLTKWANENNLELPHYHDDSVILSYKDCNNEVVGFCQVYHYVKTNELYLAWIFVREDYRGHKVFSKMFRYLKTYATLYNADKITSYVLVNNLISNAVHKKLGFIIQNSESVKILYKEASRFNGYTYFLKKKVM